jgi:peptidyl-prolyl cis-trans isomerase A (cyclophilin A)
MRSRAIPFLAALASFCLWCAGQPMPAAAQQAAEQVEAADAASQPAPAVVRVLLTTPEGEIELALEKDRAPVTTANFLRYVDQKRYDGATFYRGVLLDEAGKYALLQGGLRGDPKKVLKPIAHEAPATTGLSHVDGAVSMAHSAPGTATADWFIVVGDLVSMDGKGTAEDPGYAVFGHVTRGMDVVRRILQQPRDPEAGQGVMKGQIFASPVKILTARRAD